MSLQPLRPILIILAFAGTLLSAVPAGAATITVNSFSDTLANDGGCTLREAIIAANTDTSSGAMAGECAAGSGTDAITLSAGTYTLSIAGVGEGAAATGDLDVAAPLTITGAGVASTTIDAAGIDRAFDLTSTLSLTDLTIRGGDASGPDTIGEGGGILITGGTLTVTRTKFADNVGFKNGGGTGGAMTLKSGSTATVLDSTFTGNYGRNCGGSICVYAGNMLTVRRSTFTADQYTDYGGAINNNGTATIENSTFSGNIASGGGGAIYSTGSTTITSSTIAGNIADSDGFSGGDGGGIDGLGTVTLTNTLVAGNSVGGSGSGPDCSGTVTSAGYNLIGNNTACTVGSQMGSDLVGTGASPIDPMLGALLLNGGPTRTRALLSGSPAIDAGTCASLATDQRDATRPQGATCDIGAFEVVPTLAAGTTFYVGLVTDQSDGGDCTNLANTDCSLRDAISAANENENVGFLDTIQVPSGTHTLSVAGIDEDLNATGDLDVASDVTIDGQGLGSTIVSAAHIDRVFHVVTGVVTFSDMTIRLGGIETGDGTCNGAGIFNGTEGGTVTVDNASLSSNRAGEGGGIYNASGRTMTITNTTVSENTGLKRGAGITNVGTMTIDGSTIGTNQHFNTLPYSNPPCPGTASFGAGGIFNVDGGDLTVTDSEISSNSAEFTGGGIYNYATGSTVTVNRSTISGNSAAEVGGGVATASGATSTLTNSTISGNSAAQNGGGVYGSANTTISSSTVTGNTSQFGTGGLRRVAPGTFSIANSIVRDGCSGTITSQDHNIETGTSCGFNQPDDQPSTDPMLGALANNGGTTYTHMLLAASPAIDNGDCPSLLSDQRGIPRPQGAGCDIGAFETTPPSSSITFPADAGLYNATSFAAGCGGGIPDTCGTAMANPDGAALATTETRIQRGSDDAYWDGDSWEAGEAWSAATGTATWSYGFSPADDTYTLSSRAIDGDGYVESTATATFTVDTTPPDTTITGGPSGIMEVPSATFTFSSGETGSTFECRLDGAAFAACTSPRSYTGLASGSHTFEVRAIDTAGNVDATPATATWTVLLVDPRCADPGVICGTSGPDHLVGTSGNDLILGGGGNDFCDGAGGNDVINCGAGNDTVLGGAGNDVLSSTTGNDTIRGGPGKDRIRGGPGKDRIRGGPGKDRIRGGPGKDRLFGGPGADRLFGQSGRDRLNGGAGTDRCRGGTGLDLLQSCEL